MRVSGDSVARYRAATHAEHLYESHVLFDHDYDLADTTKMYCTELIDFVYRKEGIDLPEACQPRKYSRIQRRLSPAQRYCAEQASLFDILFLNTH